MRTLIFITALALMLINAACQKATSAGLAGSYTAERPHGLESLDLNTNGTYVQVFTNASVARTNTGQWSYQAPVLTLKGALMFVDGANRPASPVVTNDWKLQVRRVFNIWVVGDGRREAFTQVTPENQ